MDFMHLMKRDRVGIGNAMLDSLVIIILHKCARQRIQRRFSPNIVCKKAYSDNLCASLSSRA